MMSRPGHAYKLLLKWFDRKRIDFPLIYGAPNHQRILSNGGCRRNEPFLRIINKEQKPWSQRVLPNRSAANGSVKGVQEGINSLIEQSKSGQWSFCYILLPLFNMSSSKNEMNFCNGNDFDKPFFEIIAIGIVVSRELIMGINERAELLTLSING